MASRGGLSGLALAEIAAGVILAWSGIENASLTATLRSAVGGKKPVPDTGNEPVTAAATGTPAVTAPGNEGAVSGNPGGAAEKANQSLGRVLAAAYGWAAGPEWTALNDVVMEESGWNATAQNPSSTAYGIGQFLDTTWAAVGYSKSSDPLTQIAAMLAYIKQRYGDPVRAQAFHLANNYY